MMDINVDFLQWSIIFFDKKASGSGIKNENMSNKKLAKNLHKPVVRKFKKIIAYSLFINNIQSTDLPDMQQINKLNKGIRFL